MRKKKFSAGEKARIVREYLFEQIGIRGLSRRYGINHGTIADWIALYQADGINAFLDREHNKTYNEETKRKAVEDYLHGEGSQRTIITKYGIRSRLQLQTWIREYNSGRGFRQKMSGGSRMKEVRPTTVEERIQIAKDCISNGGNYGETALKFNVSYQQVYQWVKKYKEFGDAGLEDRRGKRKKDQTPRTELEKAQIEIERLKHELYMTQMERDLLKKLEEIERREAYRK